MCAVPLECLFLGLLPSIARNAGKDGNPLWEITEVSWHTKHHSVVLMFRLSVLNLPVT